LAKEMRNLASGYHWPLFSARRKWGEPRFRKTPRVVAVGFLIFQVPDVIHEMKLGGRENYARFSRRVIASGESLGGGRAPWPGNGAGAALASWVPPAQGPEAFGTGPP